MIMIGLNRLVETKNRANIRLTLVRRRDFLGALFHIKIKIFETFCDQSTCK